MCCVCFGVLDRHPHLATRCVAQQYCRLLRHSCRVSAHWRPCALAPPSLSVQHTLQEMTEASWLRQREDSIAHIASAAEKRKWEQVGAEADEIGESQRCPGISVEQEQLEIKARLRLLEAAEAGHALPHELDTGVPTEIAAVRAARDQRGRALARDTSKKELLTSRCRAIQLYHLRMHVASDITAAVSYTHLTLPTKRIV